jgi:hypothetical protein
MTAYTMNVVVVNETDADVRWVGASTLSSLDGETSVGPLSVEANSHGKTVISKRGGKQGLFTALTWGVGSADPRFSVYVRMPAAIDDITASLRDVFGMDVHQFENSSAADYCEANTFHGNPNNKDSPKRTSVLVDSFVYHGYNVRAVYLSFPS